MGTFLLGEKNADIILLLLLDLFNEIYYQRVFMSVSISWNARRGDVVKRLL